MESNFILIIIYLTAASNFSDMAITRQLGWKRTDCERVVAIAPLGRADSDGDVLVKAVCVQAKAPARTPAVPSKPGLIL